MKIIERPHGVGAVGKVLGRGDLTSPRTEEPVSLSRNKLYLGLFLTIVYFETEIDR